MTNNYAVLIAGVGGMGAMSTSNVLKEYGIQNPNIVQVRASESRGVSQREGSVYACVKYVLSEKMTNESNEIPKPPGHNIVLSPHPRVQSVDVLLAIEPLEFLRNLHFLKTDGVAVINNQKNVPKSCITSKEASYPEMQKKITQVKALLPDLKIISNNYTRAALAKFNLSIMANVLMLNTLPEIDPRIFDPKSFTQIVDSLNM